MGTGIKIPAHMTLETTDELRAVDEVIHMTETPALDTYLTRLGVVSCNLMSWYKEGAPRKSVYSRIANHVVARATGGRRVAYLVTGTPILLNTITALIRTRAKKACIPTRLLPAVSSIDTVLTEIGFDPGDTGIQCYEATQLLNRRIRIDRRVPLLIFQAGLFGTRNVQLRRSPDASQIRPLVRKLVKIYSSNGWWCLVGTEISKASGTSIRQARLSELLENAPLLARGTLLVSDRPFL